jgi:hypothetical protein
LTLVLPAGSPGLQTISGGTLQMAEPKPATAWDDALMLATLVKALKTRPRVRGVKLIWMNTVSPSPVAA